MKISKILFMAIVAMTTVFISCSKDKADPQPTTLEGRWVGSYVKAATGNSFYYSLNIKPGGVIEELNNSGLVIGLGNWKFENDILTAKYAWKNGSEFSIIAAFYKNEGKLLGDWGYDDNATNGGTWEMHKAN